MASEASSFASVHPELVAYWHPTMNGKLQPTQVAYFGEKGHLFRFQSGHPSERSDAGWFRMG